MAAEQFANLAQTSLNGAIAAGDLTLVVVSASLFPTNPQFRIRIDDEVMIVTGVAGTTFTVTRGAESTSAASHASGTLITCVLTAGALNNFPVTSIAFGTALQVAQTNAGGTGVEWGTSTGIGNVARATSPTFVTPVLGTPASGVLTNCTGLLASGLQQSPTDLGNTDITVDLSNSHAGKVTNLIIDGILSAGTMQTGSVSLNNLLFASGGTINWNGGDVTITHAANILSFAGASTGYFFDALVAPIANDAAALGAATNAWSDLFLASGAVINFDNGNAVVTHSGGIITVSTGDLRVTTAGTNSASAVTVAGTQTLTNKTLTSPTLTTPTLGDATATTVNKVTITAPADSATLTIANTKTLTVNGDTTLTSGTHSGTNTGDQTTILVADETSDTTCFLAFFTAATGTLGLKTNAGLTYDSSANALTAQFANSSGIRILDTNASNYLGIIGGSNLTADRTWTITTGDAGNHTLDISGVVAESLLYGSGTRAIGTFTMAANVRTFLTTPSSANLAAALTDETGSGLAVFATSPTLVTPLLGTPTSGVLTNCTGTASGVTAGAATVLATARGINGQSFDGSAAIDLDNNLLINGGFDYFQRASASTAMTDAVYNGPDRWYSLIQGANPTCQQVAVTIKDPDSLLPPNVIRLTSGGTTNRFGIAQAVEAIKSESMTGRTAMLSFRVRANKNAGSGTIDVRIALLEWTGTADTVTKDFVNDWTSSTYTTGNFFTSTSTALVATAQVSVTHSTTAYTTVSLSGAVSANCKNLVAMIWVEDVPAHASDYIDVTEADLYPGSVARFWQPRLPAVEDAMCRWFYEKKISSSSSSALGSGQMQSTTNFRAIIWYTPKRTSPTVTLDTAGNLRVQAGGTNYTPSANSVLLALTTSAHLSFTVSSATAGFAGIVYAGAASTYYEIDAEL